MKILFLGDYSNLHAVLASELRRLGHYVTVVSDGGRHLKSRADICLSREPGRLNAFRYLFEIMNRLPALEGYDVVQLINPHFLELKPGRIRYFLEQIRRKNKSLFLTLAGDDHFFIKACLDEKTFPFSEYRVGSERTRFSALFPKSEKEWMCSETTRYTEYLYSVLDGGMAVLPEYQKAAEPVLTDRLSFTNLPIDLSTINFNPVQPEKKVKLFVGIRREQNREIQKGTEDLARLALELQSDYPERCEAVIVENLPLKDYLERLNEADIVLDQLYALSPATNALQTMASGKVAASGVSELYYNAIGEEDKGAVIPLSPLLDNKETLRRYILDPSPLRGMALEGRRLVETHNDVMHIAPKFIAQWEKRLK